MNYKEAIQYLDSFTDYEKIGYKSREAFDLKRMRRLAEVFDSPQESFPVIHIAGTKGKGSIAAFISNILKEAGFRTGLYTSPHLIDSRERIKIDGEMISKDEVAFYTGEIKEKLDRENLSFSPTFFEIYTLLAFNYFRAKKIDYGVIEAGLGGRLDATNIIKPMVSVIAPISYDHTHILGDTLEKIAIEKSDIIKKGCTVVIAPQEKEAFSVIEKRCESLGVKLILAGRDIKVKEIYHDSEKEIFDIQGTSGDYKHCISHLIGQHQILNAACAIGAVESLERPIRTGAVRKPEPGRFVSGIEKTENPGRCEIIARSPYIVLDGAQNRASAHALKETIKRNFDYKRLILILGISKAKDIQGVCEELAPLADTVILTKANIERREEPDAIAGFIKEKNLISTDSVEEALRKARSLAKAQDMILVTGSFFVLGEVKLHGLTAVEPNPERSRRAKRIKFEKAKLSI
jgi:dihydrofolate synthase/folylpolyglutamate synthase